MKKMKIFVRQLLSLWPLLLTLPISVRSCTEDVSCTFGLVGQCGWNSLSEKQFEMKWKPGNIYMSVDMGGDTQAHVTSLYGSPLICKTNVTHSFTFRYSLENGENCHMTSYAIRSDGINISLWDTSVFMESEPYSQLPPALICPQDTVFQIIIQVTKIRRGGCGEVRVDDVEYYSSTSNLTTCTVTPSTSTPGLQRKTTSVVKSADILSSLKSQSLTSNTATVWSLSSETPHTGTTPSSNSATSSTDLRETTKKGYSLRPLPPLPATVSGLKMKMFVRQLLSLWSLLLTVPISARSCTKDVTCTFGSGQCGWYSLSEKQFESKRTYSELKEFLNGYMSVDMGGDAQANVTSLYGSPPICSTKHAHSFTFRYSLENGKNCYMTSYVSRSDGKNISLWDSSVFVEHGPYSQLLPALVCPQDTTFQIIIQVTKIRRGECGEVRIDDVKYDLTRDTRTCTVTPSTSTPSVQGKTSLEVTSADTLSSLNSNSVTTNIVTVSSLLSESSHTGTTLSSNSAKSSTDLRETEKKSPATSAPAVQVNISSGTPPAGTLSSPNSTLETSHPYYPERFSATTLLPQETPSSSHSAMSVTDVKSPEAQRGSASQDKMSAGLGAGIGITVCIIFIVSASVTVIVVRKKSKATSEKRTNIILNTAASIHETAGNEKPRNTQEPIAPDGDMTVHTELPVHQRTTRDDRMTSSDHVITEGDSFQDSSQENYSVLFSKVSGEQTTQHFELDTYSHLQAQSAAGDVSHDNKTLRISELEQRNMSADSKASAPPATDDDYVALRASLNSHGIASDVYDHLKNELYVNDPTKR